ncbi:solute carrier family 15 member 2 isoform X2 [Syngnathoides biaculeatus]|uniref:solute carrier family 15 member 2 isoform X2 n=1 Tax=Syngnathoides biaculeatus TaxID=300417 RepID=UPI002ADE3E59|nr:solute carrier family 15 member 2 isoform X2 [Syngnathoides biaculeatus]
MKLCGTNYPASICFIVVNEFCERFSYYGMKAVLTLYFLTYLGWDHDLSTAVYHAFSSLCYFTPVLGAIIADTWLGKFKTIIYLSVVYVFGHVIKSVGAVPTVGSNSVHMYGCLSTTDRSRRSAFIDSFCVCSRGLSMTGLILIAFGTGGIKPCVAAFGGDQFESQHVTERMKFFSIFYMAINAGSLLSTIITPILRGDVQCFGGDCYALAFGVPAALMMVALVVFILGSSLYRRNPPEGNILMEVCNCVGFAIKNRWRRSKYESSRSHWLDWAEDKYSKRLIVEIKMVLRVLVLYIPLPMFWALFDQQGSRWTLQATRMNLAFGDTISIKPDQMQTLNALLILVFVPVFDLLIYPLVSLCRINITPLRKMATGMIFAALAFGAAALVEVHVVKTEVAPAPAGKCLLQVFNLAPGDVRLHFPEGDPFPQPLLYLQDPPEYLTLPLGAPRINMTLAVHHEGVVTDCNVTFGQQEAYSLILHPSDAGIRCKLVEDHIKKNTEGAPLLRFVNTLSEAANVTVGDETFHAAAHYSVSANKTVQWGDYTKVSCTFGSKTCPDLDLGLLDFGASYTVVLLQESGRMTAHKMEDVHANNVHVAWQIPQYVLITAGEVMFSITGLEFSYSQAPANMKSVLQAGWLLTVAFGNVIVLIVAEGAGLEQWKEFLLFSGLLLAVCMVFSVMAHLYTYVDLRKLDKSYPSDHNGRQRGAHHSDDDDSVDTLNKKKQDLERNTRL